MSTGLGQFLKALSKGRRDGAGDGKKVSSRTLQAAHASHFREKTGPYTDEKGGRLPDTISPHFSSLQTRANRNSHYPKEATAQLPSN